MDKSYLLKLTQAVYRVTELFPEGEPLKFQIREKANEILTDLILHNPGEKEKILKNLEILENYFEIARIQNWVNHLNFLVLSREYSKIKESLFEKSKPISEKTIEQPIEQPHRPLAPNSQIRHQKILEILKEKGRVQVWEIKRIFPEVSKRTLRRDFDYLLRQGIIERIGEKNNTFYKIKEIGQIGQVGQKSDVLS